MFKKICFAALAVTAGSAIGQTTAPAAAPAAQTPAMTTVKAQAAPDTRFGYYGNDLDLLNNPPVTNQPATIVEMIRNCDQQAMWISAGDSYDFKKMLQDEDSNIAYLIVKAVYNARLQTYIARHDLVAQQVSAFQQSAMSSQPPTVVATNDYAAVQNHALRSVFCQQTTPDVTYHNALDIINDSLTTSETSAFDSWWRNGATDHEKDILVRLIKKDAWILTVPVYPSTLTTRSY